MIGYVYILSAELELDDLTQEVWEKVGFYIQYEDGQFIKSYIRVKPNNGQFHKKVIINIEKYFKGDLKLIL